MVNGKHPPHSVVSRKNSWCGELWAANTRFSLLHPRSMSPDDLVVSPVTVEKGQNCVVSPHTHNLPPDLSKAGGDWL